MDIFRDNDLGEIKLNQRKSDTEADLMMGSFVGDSKKLIPELYGQEVATERGQVMRGSDQHMINFPLRELCSNTQQEQTMDQHLPAQESLEDALNKKPLKSERSIMTQQPQPTASKEQFNDYKQNFMVNLDESGNMDFLTKPIANADEPAEQSEFDLTIANQLNELKAFQNNMEKELEDILTGRGAGANDNSKLTDKEKLNGAETSNDEGGKTSHYLSMPRH